LLTCKRQNDLLFVAIRLPQADCGVCEKTIIQKVSFARLTGSLDDRLRADESNAGGVCMNLRQITAMISDTALGGIWGQVRTASAFVRFLLDFGSMTGRRAATLSRQA
jgi:hypothetical protein